MFKKIFIKLCASAGESPSAVCKKIGISPAAFSQWSDTTIPRKVTLQNIADYFGVSLDYLLGKEEAPVYPAPAKEKRKGVRIPVYGNVAAGVPLEAITDIEDWEEISEDMAADGDYIALRINGDSMEPRMTRGDIVIVRLQPDIESGDIAIVMVNGCDATCKKVQKTPDGVVLVSLNASYAPMFYTNKQIAELPLTILGRVVELRAKF